VRWRSRSRLVERRTIAANDCRALARTGLAALQNSRILYAGHGIIARHKKLSDLYTNKFVE
jgi:hypothetical protein